MKHAFRISGSLISHLLTAFSLVTSAASVKAAMIFTYQMDSYTFLSDAVVYCQEESVKKVSIEHGNYTEKYISIKCKVLRTFKGDVKPGAEITVDYGSLFGRNPMAGYVPPQKYDDVPLGKALVFLKRKQTGGYDVLDAKLVQKDAIYRFVQRSNPGGLGLAKQAPENITLPKTQGYDERALLQDMTLALKKSQSLQKAEPMRPWQTPNTNGFAYDDPADNAIDGMRLSKLKASCDYLFPISKERELKSIESESLNLQNEAEQMKAYLAIPGDAPEDPDDRRNQAARYATEQAGMAKSHQEDLEMWLARNCRQGCSLYLYQHRHGNSLRSGYCVVKDGVCANSLVQSEDWADPRAPVFDGKNLSLTIIGGDGQTTTPGEFASAPLVVELRDSAGKPVPNAPLDFQMENNYELKGAGLRNEAPVDGNSPVRYNTHQATDAKGRAQAFFRQPFRSNCKTRISAWAGAAKVKFTETTSIDDKPPTPPGDVQITVLNDKSVRVDWKDYSDNATGFVIRQSDDHEKTWYSIGVADAYATKLIIPPQPPNPGGALSYYSVVATSPFAGAKRDLDKSIKDYSEAIQLDPKDLAAYFSRATAYEKNGDFSKAIEDYKHLSESEPETATAYNAMAWIYATCPKDDIRNGEKAVNLAIKACELSWWINEGPVDTLAAAEAEAGHFKEAVDFEELAIKLTRSHDASAETKSMEDRATLYQQHKPYRDAPGEALSD